MVDAMITVNYGLANEYERNYGIRPFIMTNANYFHNITPSLTSKDKIRMVHHGAANPSRKIELMIELMNFLDARFTLDLFLITPTTANKKTAAYLDFLKSLVINNPKVKIYPPVKNDEVVTVINHYDLGVCFIPHVNFNYQHGLPNKLFDFVQARLAIAIGPTDEMTKMVKSYNLGVVSENFEPESPAKELNSLTADKIDFYKNQSDKAARELSAEKNKEILHEIIFKLIGEK